jgi:hypothetical protein
MKQKITLELIINDDAIEERPQSDYWLDIFRDIFKKSGMDMELISDDGYENSTRYTVELIKLQ